MAISSDVERGDNRGMDEMGEPLIQEKGKVVLGEEDNNNDLSGRGSNTGGSSGLVLLSTFVAVCGSYDFGSCVGYSAPVQAAIRDDLNLSLAEYSIFGSILTVGAMIGSMMSGHISDLIGRKGAMRISAALSIGGWLAVYFSKGALSLDVGRFLTGYGIGVFSYVVPVFIAEIAPKNLRGGLATLNQLMIAIGASNAFIIGSVVTWRTLALTGIIPCLVQLLGLFLIPESPRWLAKAGHQKEFEIALQKLRGNNDISHEAAEIQDHILTLDHLPKAKMLDLFQRRYLYSVTVGVGLFILQQFGGVSGLGYYASETFASAGFTSGKLGTIIYACLQIPITAISTILMDKSGRKPLLMASATGTFLGCFLAGISFYMKDHGILNEWVPTLILAGVLLYIGSFSIGMGAVPWVLMSEIFPINVKGTAGSLVTLVHWTSAWAVSYTFNFLMSWSSSGTFFLYSGFCAITILFVAKLVPETKGRSLEEIQASTNC